MENNERKETVEEKEAEAEGLQQEYNHDPYGNLAKGENNQYGSDKNGAFVEYSYEKYELGRHWIRYLEVEE